MVPQTTGNALRRTRTREAAAEQTELLEGKMTDTSGSAAISTRLQRIAELAKIEPKMVLTNLSQHIDVQWLKEAQERTRKDGASGVDGETAESYAAQLEENLRDLHERFKSGRYRAPPVKRVEIPKGDGKTRPIGIPTYEDKVLQRAVVMALEEVYEQDFLDCSYGFRPKRSAHQALDELWRKAMRIGGGFVIELDIENFFDTLDHEHLRNFLDQRVRDGVIRRTIGKWLNAGVLHEGQVKRTTRGSPQGGVVSPMLANIYLHEVLDKWFAHEVKPRLRGEAFMVRYADDGILVFSNEEDARRVFAVLPKRFEKYGLRLHPEKTRLLDFRKSGGGSETFDLLGFTHFWGKSRRGKSIIMKKTSGKSFRRALKRVSEWCRLHRHDSIDSQHRTLSAKVSGHYAYFGVTGNARALSTFTQRVQEVWRKWLDRRSHRARMNWERFGLVLRRFPLPPVRVVHSIYRTRSEAVV